MVAERFNLFSALSPIDVGRARGDGDADDIGDVRWGSAQGIVVTSPFVVLGWLMLLPLSGWASILCIFV